MTHAPVSLSPDARWTLLFRPGRQMLLAGTLCLSGACILPPQAPIIVPAPEVADDGLAPAQVSLPAVPPLTILDHPRTYDNGSYSVSGLMLARDALRDESLSVTGIISSVYACQGQQQDDLVEVDVSALPVGEAVPSNPSMVGCNLPHFYVVDNVRSNQRLLVTDYDPTVWEPQLRVGNRYLFRGQFTQRARGFTSTEHGLLRLEAAEGSGIADVELAPAGDDLNPVVEP